MSSLATKSAPIGLDAGPIALFWAAPAAAGFAGLVAGPGAALAALSALLAGAAVVLAGAHRAGRLRRFGAANRITAARGAAVAGLIGVLPYAETLSAPDRWAVLGLAAAALAADGIDGPVARKRGEADGFGARFDMETDAVFMLALSLAAWLVAGSGPWVLAAGLLRYLFWGASLAWPRLGAPLAPSRRRRVACALGAGLLVAALAPIWPAILAEGLAAAAVAVLLGSFAVDVGALIRAQRSPTARSAAAPARRALEDRP